jgi:hypothetical protein
MLILQPDESSTTKIHYRFYIREEYDPIEWVYGWYVFFNYEDIPDLIKFLHLKKNNNKLYIGAQDHKIFITYSDCISYLKDKHADFVKQKIKV